MANFGQLKWAKDDIMATTCISYGYLEPCALSPSTIGRRCKSCFGRSQKKGWLMFAFGKLYIVISKCCFQHQKVTDVLVIRVLCGHGWRKWRGRNGRNGLAVGRGRVGCGRSWGWRCSSVKFIRIGDLRMPIALVQCRVVLNVWFVLRILEN